MIEKVEYYAKRIAANRIRQSKSFLYLWHIFTE